ncbi:hypothetical protein [Sphingomonas profundi]|uniref:hypothetical protein n=1 Tax=Alterirhizorhabdus profundi TaxID=2681549 RepID=UPI0012E7485C|nr:hypothetical protein [Sphingomonas profundi]
MNRSVQGGQFCTPISPERGQHCTLIHRNATGGLIQVKTKDPSATFGGKADLSYGNYETLKGDFYLTGPVAPHLSADIAVVGTTMGDGYGRNLASGKYVGRIDHDVGVRSKWFLSPGEGTEARLIFDYSDDKNSLAGLRVPRGATIPAPFGPAYGGSDRYIDANYEPLNRIKTGGVSLRVDQKFDAFSVASITAFRKTDFIGPSAERRGQGSRRLWGASAESRGR